MIAFLIDADNFSAPAWVDEAFHTIERTEGSIAIRRAYGSAENLKGLADTLRNWAIRPFANLPLPKNTTDMSLAVDAMELACLTPSLNVIAVGSGDLDFVPLVVRLRERGIRVLCVTERSKMAQDAMRAYDQVIFVGNDQPARLADALSTSVAPIRAAPKKAVPKSPAVKPNAPKPPAVKATPVKKVAAKATQAPKAVVTVDKILAAVPGLESGEWQSLGIVAKVLHDEKLLAKSATTPTLFKKFPHHFELKPEGKPNQVRFILPP